MEIKVILIKKRLITVNYGLKRKFPVFYLNFSIDTIGYREY